MRAVTLAATGGADAGLTGRIQILGAELTHTTDATCSIQLTDTNGQEICNLTVSDEIMYDRVWWAPEYFDCTAVFYTLSAGSLNLWIK